MTDTASPRPFTFTLYDSDIDIIESAIRYDASRSAALRRIIREWAQLHQPERVLVDTKEQYDV